MRVRITFPHPGELYGISLSTFQVGLTYDVSPTVATYLITMGCGDAVIDDSPALVVPVAAANTDAPCSVNVITPAALATDDSTRTQRHES